MIKTPTAPVQDLVERLLTLWQRIAFQFLDEVEIMTDGMSNPNKIVTTPLYFEKLESEPSPRRRVAQQLRRSQERTHQRLVERATKLITSLYAAQSV